ncbi:hypothetical protein Emag_007597 [Eimeria magna]
MQRAEASTASEAPEPQARDGGYTPPDAAGTHRQQQHQGASMSHSSSSGSSSSNNGSGSNSGSSTDVASCCSGVYAQRVASFKGHPSAAAARQQRIDLSSSLRAEGRANLLRQLREEAARVLEQQQQQLLQPPDQQQQQQGGGSYRGRPSFPANNASPSSGASCEALEAQRLRQLMTQPRTIVEPPQDLVSGDYLAALRPEGRSCLLLLRNGKGHLYDKKERAVFRVVCSSSSAAAAAATTAAAAAAPLFNGSASMFPTSLEEGLQQHDDASPFLPPEEKQRLLLLRAGSFDVARCLSSGAAAANSKDSEEVSSERAHAAYGAESTQAIASMEREVQQQEQQEEQQKLVQGSSSHHQQQQQQQQRWQQYKQRRQQQYKPPLLHLPTGILSKGLTLLECILCPFTPANVEYFSARRSAEGPAPAAAAAAAAAATAAGKGVAWKREEPMWQVLFIVDVLFLGGTMLGQCEFECRHFFLKSRPFVYPPDGFLFYHKEAPHVGGSNPFLLCWRDEGIARFPLDEKNVGQSRVDTFLIFHSNGEAYSDDGILTARVDPEAFGITALPGPSVLHCWVSNLSADSGLFLEVQLPPDDMEQRRPSFHFKQMELDAPFQRFQQSVKGEQDEDGSAADCPGLNQGEKQGNPHGSLAGQSERGKWGQQTAAATTSSRTRRQQLQHTGSRSRMQNKWKHKDRVADSYTKLVDQWLRLRGVHPVSFEVLLSHCPA